MLVTFDTFFWKIDIQRFEKGGNLCVLMRTKIENETSYKSKNKILS